LVILKINLSATILSSRFRVKFNRLNQKVTHSKLRQGQILVQTSECHSKFLREYQRKGFGDSSPLIWLFIGVSLKITKLRSAPVLPSYIKKVRFYSVVTSLLLPWRLKKDERRCKTSPLFRDIVQKICLATIKNDKKFFLARADPCTQPSCSRT